MSTPTERNRLELQDYASNEDVWGDRLNRVFRAIDKSLDGVISVEIGLGRTLEVEDFLPHEAQSRVLRTTGAGILTVPDVEKLYYVEASQAFQISTGAETKPVPEGFSIIVTKPLTVHALQAVAGERGLRVHEYPAAIRPEHAFGLVILDAAVSIALADGQWVDVKAQAPLSVGGFRFAAGSSARLIKMPSGYLTTGETEGVNLG